MSTQSIPPRKKLLYVDDEPEWTQPYVNALRNTGYDVLCVRSRNEAIDALGTHRFDLIVLDVILPEGRRQGDIATEQPRAESGLLLHDYIRTTLRLTDTPIVFVTIVRDTETRLQIQELERRSHHIARIVTKPDFTDQLLKHVEDALQR